MAVMTLTVVGLSFNPAAHAGPGTSPAGQLTCFAGGSQYGADTDGTCVRKGGTFTLSHDELNLDYAGIAVANQNLEGQLVRDLGLTFTYAGDAGGGSPRFSIALHGGGGGRRMPGEIRDRQAGFDAPPGSTPDSTGPNVA